MNGFRFVVTDDPAELASHAAAWDELAAAAVEPNPFYEAWMLLPAIAAFGREVPLRFVLVYADSPGRPASLCGFFPLERLGRYRGLPFQHLRLWRHLHCYLGTPLLRRTHARGCLEAFLDWLGENGSASMMEWGRVAGDGAFYRMLQAVLRDTRRRSFLAKRFSRAVLRPGEDADAYLRQALAGHSRKEYRRLERRLSEVGAVRYSMLGSPAQAGSWIEDFLALEARGWKGRQNSALGSTPRGRAFFTSVAAEAAQRSRLMMLSLKAGERIVAMKCNFLAHDGAFAFKIAYDEDYARFSPGALLELHNIVAFHQRPGLQWMDSCAESDHFMANRLWTDRRTIATVLTATGKPSGDLLVSSLPLLRRVAETLRGATQTAS